MKIETKYNYGDNAWYMCNNKPTKLTISELLIKCIYSGYSGGWGEKAYPFQIFYTDDYRKPQWISESLLYPTKEELLKSLE